MKTKVIISAIIVAVLIMGTANAQISLSIQKTSLTGSDKAILDQRISKYTAFTMDNKKLADNIYGGGGGQFRLRIDEEMDWLIDLELNDLRAPDYKATYTTDEGTFECKEPFVVNTFKGSTSDGHVARFTIDENSFFGVVLYDDYHYVIRPAKDYTQRKGDKNFIMYHSWDIIPDDSDFDYINDALEFPEKYFSQDIDSSPGNTSITSSSCSGNFLKIATDADHEFHRATVLNDDIYTLLENVTNVRILSILNIVEGVYESTFGLKFLVTFQHVYTTPSQPYVSNDASTLLNSFRSYWNTNHTNVKRNIAHLFTGKNITTVIGGIVFTAWGITYTGTNINGNVANNYAYSVSMNRPEMYQSTAHEIGHNFGASENPANCSCNTPSASVMCQGIKASNLWFCNQSQSEINYAISNNLGLLVGICGSTPLCFGSLKTFSASSWQTGYYWDKGAGLSFSGSTTVDNILVSAASSGTFGQSYVCIKNSSGNELARYVVWFGNPSISIYAPYDVVPQTGYEAILSYNNAPYTLQGVTSFNWTCSSNLKLTTKLITHAGFMVNKMSGVGIESATINVSVSNACGSASTYQGLNIHWPSPSPPPSSYPNPVNDILNIETGASSNAKGASLTYDVRLYDGQGNLQRQTSNKGGTIQFNVSSLPDGIYYLHIYDGVNSTPEMQQIVVQH